MGFSNGWSGLPDLKNRFLILSLLAAGIFLLLLFRLWYLQVVQGENYTRLSEQNRHRSMTIAAPRGPIFDRDGLLLVDNRPSFNVSIMRQDVEDKGVLLPRLAEYLGGDLGNLEERWQKGRRYPIYRPVVMAEDVGRNTLDVIQENSLDLPGVITEVQPVRHYPFQETAAHLFGYLSEITEEELRSLEEDQYRSGDFIGKSGIEKHLENYLRGEEGTRLVEVDVQGKQLRQLKTRESLPGNKVYLTLRRDVQLAAEQAFGDQAGALVALEVHTGEILAMVSRPSFNPEIFARGISGQEWIELLRNPRNPLQFKAINGQYPPGSTFKIVTALAALQAGVAGPATAINCTGSVTVGNREFRCWKKRGHGLTDLKKAIRESCDVWFYQVGLELGIDRLSEMAFALGLGKTLEFPLQGEKSGLIPTRQWKKKRFGSSWYDGETVIAAIGQGYVLATPLQLAVMTAAVANGGKVLQPRVVKRIEDWQGKTLWQARPEVRNTVKLEPRHLQAVQRGLAAVVNELGGTGWACRLKSVRVAGKTGTSQVVRRKEDEEEKEQEKIPYRFRDHALFVSYAPVEDPVLAVAVVVEHGEHGSTAAAPITRKVYEAYFNLPSEKSDSAASVAGD